MRNKAAIISPGVDLLCVGALSFFAIATWVIVGLPLQIESPNLGALIALATIVNGAHFLASYRVLYQHSRRWRNFPFASVVLPFLMLCYAIWALSVANTHPLAIQAIFITTAFYLAVHYTGQTWGMIAAFAHLSGIKISTQMRSQVRFALKLLLLWQILWALQLIHDLPLSWRSLFPIFQAAQQLLFFTAFALASYAFFRSTQLNTKALPARMLLPFYALLCWYLLLQKYPAALLVVQLSHAVQYLIFPIRLELNTTPSARMPFLIQYGTLLGGLAAVVFLLVPHLINQTGEGFGVYSQVFLAFINIHHFYIDGCIWKLRDPAVRAALFRHLDSVD